MPVHHLPTDAGLADLVEHFASDSSISVVRWLGTFATALEAAQAYDTAARKIPGAAKRCNFPQGDQGPVSPGVLTAKHPGWSLHEVVCLLHQQVTRLICCYAKRNETHKLLWMKYLHQHPQAGMLSCLLRTSQPLLLLVAVEAFTHQNHLPVAVCLWLSVLSRISCGCCG